jgi:putative transposase
LQFSRSRKYRIYPNAEQQQKLAVQFGHARHVYNQALAARKEHYKETGKGLSAHQTIVDLVNHKQETPWLKEADSQVLQQKLRDLDTAYRNFFQKRAGYPKIKRKHDKQTIRYPQRVKFTESKTYLPKVGWVNTVFHRPLIGTQKSVTVSKTKSGRYFISVLCELDMEVPVNNNPAVGIDLGLSSFAILSTGECIASPQYFRKSEKKLAKAQRRLSRKKKGSANKAKVRVKVARLHEHTANQRKDFLHKLSHRVTTDFGFVGLETLNVKGMVRNHHLAKSISDSGWAEFVRMCKYKAETSGAYVAQVDKFFPSSKTCSSCGYVHADLQLSDRDWICPQCATELDRDLNAAINILAQATAGAAESNACGDSVRPTELLAQ